MPSTPAEPLCIHYFRTVDRNGQEVVIDPRVEVLRAYARVSHLSIMFVGSSQPYSVASANAALPCAFLDGMTGPVGFEGLLQAMRARVREMKEDPSYRGSPEILDEEENDIIDSENGVMRIVWIRACIEEAIEFCTWMNPLCYKEFTAPIVRRSIPFPLNAIYLESHRTEVARKWARSTKLGKEESRAAGHRVARRVLESILEAVQTYVEVEFPLFARGGLSSGGSCPRHPSYFDTVLYAYLRALHNIPEKLLAAWIQDDAASEQDELRVNDLLKGHHKFLTVFERYLQECEYEESQNADSPPSSFTANMRLDSGQVEESTTDRSFEAVQSSAQAEREEAVKGKKPGDFLFLGATLCVTIIAVLIQVIAGAGSATRT